MKKEMSMSESNALTILAIEAVKAGKDNKKIVDKMSEEERKYYEGTKETVKIMIDKGLPVILSCPID